MDIDFSEFLTLEKKKKPSVSFDFCIGAEGEKSSVSAVKVQEFGLLSNDYLKDVPYMNLYCASMYGAPLY